MLTRTPQRRFAAGLLAAFAAAAIAATPARADSTVGDAYARQGANPCSWTFGTSGIEKTVALQDGRFSLTSFRNRLTGAEYVDSADPSDEFRASWDGSTVTGASGGWSCAGGQAAKVDAGGADALQLDVSLTRGDLGVTRHYVVYPSETLIREWTDYRNAGSSSHTLARPSFLEQHLMGNRIRAGQAELRYMSGGRAVPGSWQLQKVPLSSDYARTFDSYDQFGCTPTATPGWHDIKTFTRDPNFDLPAWHDSNPDGGFVYPAAEHPGPADVAARAWTAPQDGVVDITGQVAKRDPQGNGVVVSITKNDKTIWDPRTLAADDTTGFRADVAGVSVNAGDVIRFVIGNNGVWNNDATNWDPTVAYQGGASYRASDGFSDTQGKNGWRYQDHTSGNCPQSSWNETSSSYIPWFSLWDSSKKDGVYLGFDYYGRWAAPIGQQDGEDGSLSLQIPNYEKALSAGEVVHSPKAFVGVYQMDLDDMTNRLLDWQYRYMWDFTRNPYFPAVRMEGFWSAGSQWTGSWDNTGTLQKVFGLSDHMRTIGADTYHRDNGWWNAPGDWNGPDFKISGDYLAKSGMKQLIYMMAYDANTTSQVYKDHPNWFQTPSPCGYADRLMDLTNPAAEKWMGDLLIGKAQQWGDFEWRNDSCPVGPSDGARQLAQDQAFRRVQRRFLGTRPGSAIMGVDSGGNEASWDFFRVSSDFSITDRDGLAEQQDASRLFPVDKMSGIPEGWPAGSCDASYNRLLMFNPDLYGDTSDPKQLDCLRHVIDLYHYLDHEGVVGRWVQQYHPTSSGSDRDWFERLSHDGRRGLVIYKGDASSAAVTVHPKGLDPNRTYDVRYELRSGSEQRTGADLMDNGVSFPNGIDRGELIYLGLPDHPGAGTDHTPPTAPASMQANRGTDMGYTGMELSWSPSTDDHWLSRYEVLRDGKVIGDVAKGTFYFDHTPGAGPGARYEVRAVDGDGNRSPTTAAPRVGLPPTAVDDADQSIAYTGPWTHDDAVDGAAGGTLSTGGDVCHLACRQFSGTQGKDGWHYQYGSAGNWKDMQGFAYDPYYGGPVWHDANSGWIYARGEHPGPDTETARAWSAPKDGVVDITSHAAKLVPQGNGVVVSITRNDQTIWGPKTIAGNDTQGIDVNAANVSVSAGDVIRFVIANNGEYSYDATPWDPEIVYHGDPAPDTGTASASWTFTGSQVTWYAKLGPDEGKAVVAIDGHPDATIDLYAPDDNNWSIPIYAKTLPTGGRHTITVTAAGARNSRSTADAISVDGFQAQTPLPSVTQESAPAITYAGSGWQVRNNARADGGALTASSHAGDSATFTFTGQSITWAGRLCRGCGEADVYVDGSYAGRVDTYGYRGPDVEQAALFERSWRSAGQHTIKLVATGRQNLEADGAEVSIDSLRVGGT